MSPLFFVAVSVVLLGASGMIAREASQYYPLRATPNERGSRGCCSTFSPFKIEPMILVGILNSILLLSWLRVAARAHSNLPDSILSPVPNYDSPINYSVKSFVDVDAHNSQNSGCHSKHSIGSQKVSK